MRLKVLSVLLLASTALDPHVAEADGDGSGQRHSANSSPAIGSEQITVTGSAGTRASPGGGLMRVETASKAVQTVTRDFIAKQSPTVNPEQLLKLLPSANVSDQDSYGLDSGQIYVRGLDNHEIGFLLDGAPLNDIGDSTFYANEVLDSENLETVSLQPGSTDLDSPTVSAAGGIVNFAMRDPPLKSGGLIDLSVGSNALNREFIRLDSGGIGNSGVRASFSFSHTFADNWRGPGYADKKHIDFKLLKEFPGGSKTSLTVAYNDQTSYFYDYPTAAQFAQFGNKFNYNGFYSGVTGESANFYRLHVNPFENVVAAAPSIWVLSPQIRIEDTPYFWHGIGNGSGGGLFTQGDTFLGTQNVSITPTGNGAVVPGEQVVGLFVGDEEVFRPGNVLKLSVDLDRHNTLTAGYWYEFSNLLSYSTIAVVDQSNGLPEDIVAVDHNYRIPGGRNYFFQNFLTKTQVNDIFVGDHARYFGDRLKIDVGFKEILAARNVFNYVPGTPYHENSYVAEPLPQLGVSWQIDPRQQVYLGISTNFRIPSDNAVATQINSFSGQISQKGGVIASEYSIAEDVGYRFSGGKIIGSIDFFNYNFTNRQLALNFFSAGIPYSQTVNAGGQTSRGVDVQLSTRPILYHLRPYATFEYLDARIDNNLATVGSLKGASVNDYLPTAGKVQVASPHTVAGLGIDYDDGRFFADLNLKYVGRQYSTLVNDESIPAFATDSVAFGYRFSKAVFAQAPELRLNLSNLTGSAYRTGVYAFQTNAKTAVGKFGSIISGASPLYYLEPSFAASVTLSSSF